ncbi:MAG: hypothetical protein WA635_09110 [Gallionella sp.]
MRSTQTSSVDSLTVILPNLVLLILLCATISLSGCKSYGPVGTQNFDPSFSRTLEKNEKLLFSTPAVFVNGTYMEGEEELYPSYSGMLLLTSERMLFAIWDEHQQRYDPSIWTSYSYIAQVKMHNNILLQYIAIVATDGSKYTYMLGKSVVDQAYAILMESIAKNHIVPLRETDI